MSVDGVFEEDHLVPIARVGSDLWFFNRLDGLLYVGAPEYEAVSIDARGRPFLVPGDREVVELIREGESLVVIWHRLTPDGLRAEPPRRHPMRLPGSAQPVDVVAGPRGSRFGVMKSQLAGTAFLVELRSGRVFRVDVPFGTAVLAVLAWGVLVGGEERHAVLHSAGTRWGAGRVVSAGPGGFVARIPVPEAVDSSPSDRTARRASARRAGGPLSRRSWCGAARR